MFAKYLDNVRNKRPLVHSITNYVTANDCANAILAIGGSPVMADDAEDVKDITKISDGLNINIGTLSSRTIAAMLEALKAANEKNIPVLLDPVGAGASKLRTETAVGLIEFGGISVIRGNISEIKALALGTNSTKGVDADSADRISEDNTYSVIGFARELSNKTGAVIVITGETDIVADTERAYLVHNGSFMMGKITGAGCILSSIMTAFIAANPDDIVNAAVAAVCAMGISGEKAYEKLSGRGSATYRTLLIDELFNLKSESLMEGAKYEIL